MVTAGVGKKKPRGNLGYIPGEAKKENGVRRPRAEKSDSVWV